MQENSSIARPHSYKRETWYRQSAVGQAPQQITKNNILGPEFLGLSGSAARSPDMINILKRLNTKRFCVACSKAPVWYCPPFLRRLFGTVPHFSGVKETGGGVFL